MNFIIYILYKKYLLKLLIQDNGYFILTINPLFFKIYEIFKILKNSFLLKLDFLMDIVAINLLNVIKYKYNIYYNLMSYYNNVRYFIKLKIKNEYEKINSLEKNYKTATWLEREIWDLFGIFFSNHIDLRRILTDYGFKGFPLKKDFPLTGFYEIRYDDMKKLIIYEKVKLTQEYRKFNFQSPWN